jgi:hypothetical protein
MKCTLDVGCKLSGGCGIVMLGYDFFSISSNQHPNVHFTPLLVHIFAVTLGLIRVRIRPVDIDEVIYDHRRNPSNRR